MDSEQCYMAYAFKSMSEHATGDTNFAVRSKHLSLRNWQGWVLRHPELTNLSKRKDILCMLKEVTWCEFKSKNSSSSSEVWNLVFVLLLFSHPPIPLFWLLLTTPSVRQLLDNTTEWKGNKSITCPKCEQMIMVPSQPGKQCASSSRHLHLFRELCQVAHLKPESC